MIAERPGSDHRTAAKGKVVYYPHCPHVGHIEYLLKPLELDFGHFAEKIGHQLLFQFQRNREVIESHQHPGESEYLARYGNDLHSLRQKVAHLVKFREIKL